MPLPIPVNLGTPDTRPPIYNSLSSSSLNVIAQTDPNAFKLVAGRRVSEFSSSIATQINNARRAMPSPMWCVDLEKYITNIVIETSAQGAGVLTVDLIDPGWELMKTQPNGESFISVDQYGYLWPPIEINFPEGQSDALWRLCQVQASIDTTASNLSLIFEDAIVSELREHDQYTDPTCAQPYPNETRAEFIRRCIKTASKDPLNDSDVGIRFIPLLPTDVFTTQDLYGDQSSVPLSATTNGRNYLKQSQGYNKTRSTLPTGTPILPGVDPYHPIIDTLKWSGRVSIGAGVGGSAGPRGR